MAGITHTPVVGTAEGSDPTKIRKSNWEADHNIADGTITLAMLAFDVATQVELNALSASLGSAAFTSAGSYEVPLTFSTGLTRIGNTITASGGGGSGTVTSVGLNGTANQLTVTGSSPITVSGSWTLSIPGSAQLSIAKLTNLTSNGLVTTSGGDGTLSVTGTSGSGNAVLVTSATLVTPTLGVASATSLTTTVLKSATTVAIQTNGTTQTVLFGTDQSATFAGVLVLTRNVASAQGVTITNSNSGGQAEMRLVNDTGTYGALKSYGSTLGVASLANKTAFGASGSIVVFAAGDNASGQSNTISLRPGGYDDETALFARGKLTLTGVANANILASTGYSITSTGTTSMLDLAGTLNGTGIVDVLKLSVTNTATNASSKLFNLYAGASGTTSVFSVAPDGLITTTGALSINGNGISNIAGTLDIAGGIAYISRSTGKATFYNDAQIAWISGASVAGGGGTVDTAFNRDSAGVVQINSGVVGTFRDLKLRNLLVQAGGQISMTSTGGAAVIGNATLVAGDATVSTTAAVTGVKIFLQRKAAGGVIGTALTYTISSGTSFTIHSDNPSDTSTVDWWIAGAL